MKWYHGTIENSAVEILKDGFDLNAPRLHDPGDFGRGVYLSSDGDVACGYGPEVLEVELNESRLAKLPNPYFLRVAVGAGLGVIFEQLEPVTDVEKLFHALAFDGGEMKTVRFRDRDAVTAQVTEAFLERGYTGIMGGPIHGGIFEVSIFDLDAVKKITTNRWRNH